MTTTEPETGTSIEPEAAAVESDTAADVDAILADPSLITLSNGEQYYVERLRTRGLLRLLKILTGGATDVLMQTRFSKDMDPEEFAGIFIGALLFSVPDQEQATVDFIKGMIRPKHFNSDPRTAAEKEANVDMIRRLNNLFDDPEIEDSMTVLTAVFKIEAPHIISLGKRVMALLEVQKKSQIAKSSPNTR